MLLDILTPVAKSYPSEMAIHSISQGMQILGGSGYCEDYPLEQYYRDARIHPMRTAGGLSSEEIERLYNAIVEVIKTAIGNKGASVANYQRPGGEPGTAHDYFKVAHRRGQPCPVCGGLIQRLVIRNRGTYYCPKCQKE